MDALTRSYRAQNLALRAQTLRDLQRLWPALDFRNLERTYPAWFAGATALLARDRTRSAGLASLYLRAHRLQAGVSGEAPVRLAGPLPDEKVNTALWVTSVVAVKRSMLAGKSPEQAMLDAFVQSSGAVTRLALDGGRETVRRTIAADPASKGWQRITDGAACDFCRMLAGRGAVYSAETADFASHDWCGCSMAPAYSNDPRPVKAYTPSQRKRSEATRAKDNARAREWIAANL